MPASPADPPPSPDLVMSELLAMDCDIDTGNGAGDGLDQGLGTASPRARKRRRQPRSPASNLAPALADSRGLRHQPKSSPIPLPDGPAAYEEIFELADYMIGAVRCGFLNQGLAIDETLNGLQGRSLVLTTNYSGIGSAEWSLKFLQKALAARGCQLQCRVYSVTDISEECRTVLAAHTPPPEHISGDLLERVPAGAMPHKGHKLRIVLACRCSGTKCKHQSEIHML